MMINVEHVGGGGGGGYNTGASLARFVVDSGLTSWFIISGA